MYDVDSLTKLYDESVELYKFRDPKIDELRKEIKDTCGYGLVKMKLRSM